MSANADPERRSLTGSVVLITGGTGSFGNRIAQHLEKLSPREVRIFSRDEKKQWEMRQAFPDFKYFIGDVRDEESLIGAMRGVDYVLHAAALKQVPSCEMFPVEALRTNAIGAHNVCNMARRVGAKALVALSTDKAVKPVNAMGMSKAMMEKIVCSQNQFDGETIFCCARYGNVMGTRGSVIPLFRKLINEGRPITVTVPEMTRFLLTLDQSVDLVLHCIDTARGGEVFVRKAPGCKTIDLARAVAFRYSPLRLDHPIIEIGIRPGEKLHEVLVNEYEMQRAEEQHDCFVIYPEYRCDEGEFDNKPFGSEYTSANTEQITDLEHVASLLDAMGETNSYI